MLGSATASEHGERSASAPEPTLVKAVEGSPTIFLVCGNRGGSRCQGRHLQSLTDHQRVNARHPFAAFLELWRKIEV